MGFSLESLFVEVEGRVIVPRAPGSSTAREDTFDMADSPARALEGSRTPMTMTCVL
jgi:hypothetical protein